MSRVFVLRYDAEFLRHVRWALGSGRRVEQRWSIPLRGFLDLDPGRDRLFRFRDAQFFEASSVKAKAGEDNSFIVKRLRLKNWFVLTAMVVAGLLVFSSCTGRESSLLRFVPVDSCAIMSLDWSSIRKDSELKRVINGDQLEGLLRQLGIESESVKTVAVFSAIDNQAVSGLLLRADFDRKEVVAGLKEKGWTESSIDGHKVYAHDSDYIAMPATEMLYAGTREGALAVFRAAEDSNDSIVSSEAYQKITAAVSMKGKPVKAFLLIPQGTLDMADAALTATSFALSLFDLGGIGQLLQAVNVARGFAFSLDKSARDKYPIELCVLLRDEEAASFINGSLNGLKLISELAATDNRDRDNLNALKQMKITRKHEVLAITMEVPGSALLPPANR